MSEQFVVFTNPGEIDPRSIKTFGVSVKETTNPIGFFGTGLKYALAIYMRLGHEVTIHSGEAVYKIGILNGGIRGKDFKFVTMNGEELPFTTELGKTWEPWQAFRELYCNSLDEKGDVSLSDSLPKPKAGETHVVIRGKDATTCYYQKDEIVLKVPSHLQITGGDVDIYNRPSFYLYYRGVRVHKLPCQALFTYNINHQASLTEDRTLLSSNEVIGKIPRAIAKMTDEYLIRKFVTAPEITFEHGLDYDWLNYFGGTDPSIEFQNVLEREYELNNEKLNRTAKSFYRKLKDKKDALHYKEEAMTKVETLQMEKCLRILPDVFPGFNDYKIMTVKSLGGSTYAIADMERRTIVISKSAFKLGTKFLMSTLIEEFMHLKTGYGDQSRQLQTYLFDSLVTMIEDYVLKEPV